MQLNEQQLADEARRLRIPVPSKVVLEQILKFEGTMLVRAVEESKKGQTRSQLYLRGVLLACHESTQDRLQRANINVPPVQTLIAIGKAEGANFGLRIKEWDEAGFQDQDTARYVRLTIARLLEETKSDVPTQSAARSAGGPMAVAVPGAMGFRPNRGNEPPAATPTPTQAPASARQHASDHAPRATQRQDDREPPPHHHAPAVDEHDMQPTRDSYRSSAQRERSGPPPARQQERRQDTRSQDLSRGRQEPQAEGEQPEYLSQHIYGGKAAACFSADVTRGGTNTVRLEAAESSAARQYDWQGKIGIQLSQRELPLVLAVFMQWLPKFEGKGHGENNSKWFTLENQGNKLYLSVNAKGRSPRGIPIMPGDGYAVTTLLIRQMLKNDPFLTPEILLSLVRKEATLAGAQATQPQRYAA